jgi:hypothetical protein
LQELNLDVSTEEFLSAERAFTFADLYAMLENFDTVAWLTSHACVMRAKGMAEKYCYYLSGGYLFNFTADGKQVAFLARSTRALSEICDFVLRLLAASVVHSVSLCKRISNDDTVINAPTLAYLMEQCQSLKTFNIGANSLG